MIGLERNWVRKDEDNKRGVGLSYESDGDGDANAEKWTLAKSAWSTP